MELDFNIDEALEAETAGAVALPSEQSLTRCQEVANSIILKQRRVLELEEELKEEQAALRELEEVTLPGIMQEVGLTDFSTADGARVEVKQRYFAHISEGNSPAALGWLRENEFGDIIKNVVSVTLGRKEDAMAQKLADLIRAEGLTPEVKESVNAATLKAFVKERYEAPVVEGQPPPALPPKDLFGVHITPVAEVAGPKKKRGKK